MAKKAKRKTIRPCTSLVQACVAYNHVEQKQRVMFKPWPQLEEQTRQNRKDAMRAAMRAIGIEFEEDWEK